MQTNHVCNMCGGLLTTDAAGNEFCPCWPAWARADNETIRQTVDMYVTWRREASQRLQQLADRVDEFTYQELASIINDSAEFETNYQTNIEQLRSALIELMGIQDCTTDCWCNESLPKKCEACAAREALAKSAPPKVESKQ